MRRAFEADLVDASVLSTLREFRVSGEPDPAQEVVASFLEMTPARLEGLRQAAQRGNVTELRAIAHLLRGSSGAVGATALSAAAAALEADGTFADADSLVARIEVLFTRTRPLLEALARGEDDL